MEELFILQEEEFQILAAAMDFTEIYGIPAIHVPDETSVFYALYEMVQKGILEKAEEGFRLAEVYRTAFQNMKSAEKILAVTGRDEESSDICFYLGDKLISLEESRQDKHAVKIGVFEKCELQKLLSERGFLPEPFWKADIAGQQAGEELPLKEETVFAEYLWFLPSEKAGKPYQSFRLLQNGCDYRIAEEKGEITVYTAYGADEFYACLESEICDGATRYVQSTEKE